MGISNHSFLALIAASALVVASCGGSSSSPEPSRPAPSESAANGSETRTVELDGGVTVELVIVDATGAPTELTQFQSFGVELVVTGLAIADGERITVGSEMTYDSPTENRTITADDSFKLADVVDGSIVQELDSHGSTVATDAGKHSVSVTGSVRFRDGEPNLAFDVSVDVEVESVQVETLTRIFLDGAFTFDAPNSYLTDERSDWEFTTEQELGVEQPLDLDVLETIGELTDVGASRGVVVLRSTRPLSHPDLDVAAQQLSESLPVAGTVTSAELAGIPSQRIDLVNDDTVVRIDVLRIGSELLVIQASGLVDVGSSIDEPLAIVESVVFDAARFPQLTHTAVATTRRNSDEGAIGEFRIPADWKVEGLYFASEDRLVAARMINAPDAESIDGVVATLTESIGYETPAEPVTLGGVGVVVLSIDGANNTRKDFVGLVQDKIIIFTVFDQRGDPDEALLDALIDSVEFFD